MGGRGGGGGGGGGGLEFETGGFIIQNTISVKPGCYILCGHMHTSVVIDCNWSFITQGNW